MEPFAKVHKIALLGAGGKMGCRITDNLLKTRYDVQYVEISPTGIEALRKRNLKLVPGHDAVATSDVVILALPDNRIGSIAASLNSSFRPGTMLIALDIAAPLAGVMPKRDDLVYFVTHPCHPSVFGGETEAEAQRDFFGGYRARQNIVCSLVQGPEDAYALGEEIARVIYAPVVHSHRCSPYQMAILEPVLSETVLGTCLTIVGEAVDEAIRRGVPAEAARDFVLGHLKVELGIVFELFEGARFSDGALQAIATAKQRLFQPDWKRVFEPEAVMESIREITGVPAA
ncbi:MAG TPA: phosphogluconate dehydrogenase C-terminal domain-containing protein [Bryobacteraceae bacterium]|nr:phosphogluconate dehydrogenase C-terminal domain-containing protein [Bryobacteraceae bacterium]